MLNDVAAEDVVDVEDAENEARDVGFLIVYLDALPLPARRLLTKVNWFAESPLFMSALTPGFQPCY
jgi:hypothetical protein